MFSYLLPLSQAPVTHSLLWHSKMAVAGRTSRDLTCCWWPSFLQPDMEENLSAEILDAEMKQEVGPWPSEVPHDETVCEIPTGEGVETSIFLPKRPVLQEKEVQVGACAVSGAPCIGIHSKIDGFVQGPCRKHQKWLQTWTLLGLGSAKRLEDNPTHYSQTWELVA